VGSTLPDISQSEFSRRLAAVADEPLSDSVAEKLWRHYGELRRWNPTLSLVGPGTADEVVERHYGEALAGLPLVPPDARNAIDVGSGAGFPGIVLAACRPALEVTLLEANARKWAFLEAACRRAALPCRCLNVRVQAPLPEGLPEVMDLLTARALKLDAIVAALDSRIAEDGRIVFWGGGDSFSAPRGWRIARQASLARSERRRVLERVRA
jgi:16S rRNA (guanine527-N7)-methyltransferase